METFVKLFIYSLIWLVSAIVATASLFASWNLVLGPWLEWREMPVSVALLAGALLGLVSLKFWLSKFTLKAEASYD